VLQLQMLQQLPGCVCKSSSSLPPLSFHVALLEKELDKRHPEEDKNIASRTLHVDKNGYEVKKQCVTLLLQVGADILATSKIGNLADPGFYASDDIRTWWYDLVDKQIVTIKRRPEYHRNCNSCSINFGCNFLFWSVQQEILVQTQQSNSSECLH
jgi:hypothetical protein